MVSSLTVMLYTSFLLILTQDTPFNQGLPILEKSRLVRSAFSSPHAISYSCATVPTTVDAMIPANFSPGHRCTPAPKGIYASWPPEFRRFGKSGSSSQRSGVHWSALG